jgi:hypothetical protein
MVAGAALPGLWPTAQAIEFKFGNGNSRSKRSLTGFPATRNIVRIQTNSPAA